MGVAVSGTDVGATLADGAQAETRKTRTTNIVYFINPSLLCV
jgi:hypothetical protein